jgi:hypothetical protein
MSLVRIRVAISDWWASRKVVSVEHGHRINSKKAQKKNWELVIQTHNLVYHICT